MKPLLLLLLALCACAGRPHTYRQGAPMAPMAPAFSPVEDAPHTLGQPGYVAPPNFPRSPNTRYLPASTEPGLWASDQPTAMIGMKLTEVLGVVVPTRKETESGADPTAVCFKLVQAGVDQGHKLMADVMRLPVQQRACFVAQAMTTCLRYRSAEHDKRAREPQGPNLTLHLAQYGRDISRAIGDADAFASTACSGVGGQDSAIEDLLQRWIITIAVAPPSGRPN